MRATSLILCGLTVASAFSGQRQGRPADTLKVGDPAPTLTLASLDEKSTLKIAGKREKPLVLIFGSCT